MHPHNCVGARHVHIRSPSRQYGIAQTPNLSVYKCAPTHPHHTICTHTFAYTHMHADMYNICIYTLCIHTSASTSSASTHATHCNTLQHTATHCNTLQHTATHCNTLQHTETHCNALQHTATHCNTLQHTATRHNLHLHIRSVLRPG